ncbi:hypothetical protein [Nocardioides dongxiaopingii]|uniref:hypothetical protein n=1 Tax=Nocardioides dongxiaopingii TaxID=2576036 RepID=UPI0010C769DA|nr:hypothetical protein [Nocardioides dongxiaopingii]
MPPSMTARYSATASTLALLVALGGTSYAAVKVGTADLKKDAVTSAKIKNGAVTGADVKEDTLGVVRNADTSRYASDAGTVGGLTVKAVDDTLGTGPGRPRFLYSSAGLDVELRCTVIGGGTRVGLLATSSRAGSRIASVVLSDTPGATPLEDDVENGDFGPLAGEFDLLVGDDGDLAQLTFTYGDPSGAVVQGTLMADVTGSATDPCSVSGFITAR